LSRHASSSHGALGSGEVPGFSETLGDGAGSLDGSGLFDLFGH